MEFLLPCLLGFAFFYLRRIWYDRRKVRFMAIIDRISLCKIEPDIILPEVKVRYKYYFDSGVYFGSNYISVTDFLGDKQFRFYLNSEKIPVLEIDENCIVSEEHIEEFLLRNLSSAEIFLDPVEPFRSEIIELKTGKVVLGY